MFPTWVYELIIAVDESGWAVMGLLVRSYSSIAASIRYRLGQWDGELDGSRVNAPLTTDKPNRVPVSLLVRPSPRHHDAGRF